MRLPYIQVDADFLGSGAGDLAELLRTSEAEAGWAMCRLWAWAVSKAATPEALGLLEDEDMQRLAERAAGWKGEPGAFLAALQRPAVGLAQREDGGAVRLLGMDRYGSTFRRMEADRARKSGGGRKEGGGNSTGTPPELRRKTQTQTQTQKEATPSGGSAVAGPVQAALVDVAPKPTPPPAAEKPKRATGANALGEFIDWCRLEVKPHVRPEAPDLAADMASHQRIRLGEAVKLHGLETCKAAFRLFMGWDTAQKSGYSLGLFAAKWESWVRQAMAQPGGPGQSGEDERTRLAREAREKYLAEQVAKKAAGGAR